MAQVILHISSNIKVSQMSLFEGFSISPTFWHKIKMQEISNVADVLFTPSLTSPNYTGTFADGQRISFNPYTVDWEDLERRCIFWSRKFITDEFASAIGSKMDRAAIKLKIMRDKDI